MDSAFISCFTAARRPLRRRGLLILDTLCGVQLRVENEDAQLRWIGSARHTSPCTSHVFNVAVRP